MIHAAILAFFIIITPVRDTTGLSDTLTQEQREFARTLTNRIGVSCCDDADGIDPVWGIDPKTNSYWVEYQGKKLPVDANADLTGVRNKLGVARAWVWTPPGGKPHVMCFLPGPTT